MSNKPVRSEVILAVTGDAPRSCRARANLRRAIVALLSDLEPRETDLLAEPDQVFVHDLVATPVLIHLVDGIAMNRIDGDLSDDARLKHFLGEVMAHE